MITSSLHNEKCSTCPQPAVKKINDIPLCVNCFNHLKRDVAEIEEFGFIYHNFLCKLREFCHPTGSRFFGGATKESDFDFYCEATTENNQKLKEMGFELKSSYIDSSIQKVFEKSMSTGPKIHVQIIFAESFQNKHKLHQNRGFRKLIRSSPKELHKQIWTMALSLLSNS